MGWFRGLLLLIVLIGVAGMVWIYSGAQQVAADAPHHPVTAWLLATTRERAVARRAEEIEAALPTLVGDALLEAVVDYEAMCAVCHFPPGQPPTALAQGLNPPAPYLGGLENERSVEELFWVTKHGLRMTGMPAWGPTHDDRELWALVALTRKFGEFDAGEYASLLATARERGIEHDHSHHDHDDHQDQESPP